MLWQFLGLNSTVFLPMKILPRLLHNIVGERPPIILIIANWSTRTWYTDIFRYVETKPWPLPDKTDLLPQRSLFYPAFQTWVLTAMSLKPKSLRIGVSLTQLFPFYSKQGNPTTAGLTSTHERPSMQAARTEGLTFGNTLSLIFCPFFSLVLSIFCS